MRGVLSPRASAVFFASEYQRDVASTTSVPCSTARRTARALASLMRSALSRRVPSRSRATIRTMALSSLARTEAEMPLFHAHEPPLADDDVVEHVDVQQLPSLDQLLCHGDVIGRRRGVARGVVVDDDDR